MASPAARLLYPPPGSASSRRRQELAAATRQARRLGHKLARGLTPAQAARAESVPETEVEGLLRDPAFHELVTAYRDLAAEPTDDARERLIRLALFLLEEALVGGNVTACCFILYEEARGRNPAALLADAAIRSARRNPLPAGKPAGAAAPSAPCRPADPADRAAWRRGAQLRDALLQEHGAERLALAEPEPIPAAAEPEPAPAAAESAPAPAASAGRRPSGRERKRQKWLARQAGRPTNRPVPKARGP